MASSPRSRSPARCKTPLVRRRRGHESWPGVSLLKQSEGKIYFVSIDLLASQQTLLKYAVGLFQLRPIPPNTACGLARPDPAGAWTTKPVVLRQADLGSFPCRLAALAVLIATLPPAPACSSWPTTPCMAAASGPAAGQPPSWGTGPGAVWLPALCACRANHTQPPIRSPARGIGPMNPRSPALNPRGGGSALVSSHFLAVISPAAQMLLLLGWWGCDRIRRGGPPRSGQCPSRNWSMFVVLQPCPCCSVTAWQLVCLWHLPAAQGMLVGGVDRHRRWQSPPCPQRWSLPELVVFGWLCYQLRLPLEAP